LSTAISTSADSGALICAGGIGIGENLYVGKNVRIDGSLTVPDITYEHIQIVDGTAEATSIDSGSLICHGGTGIAKNVHIGGSIYTTGQLNAASSNVTGDSSSLTIHSTSTDDATNISSGSAIISGGLGVAKNAYVGGNTVITGQVSAASSGITGDSSSLTIHATGTDDATNTTSGVAVISGGVGIAKNTHVGGDLHVTGSGSLGSSTVTGDISTGTLHVTSTLDSTDTSSGSAIVSGGLGVAKKLFCGQLVANQNGDQLLINRSNTPNAQFKVNLDTSGDVYFTNSGSVSMDNFVMSPDKSVRVIATTECTSTGSGAVIISGGLAVQKKSQFAGTVNINDTTGSTNDTTGALVVSGGIGTSDAVQCDYLRTNGNYEAVNLASGSAQITGGCAVTKRLNVGGVMSGYATGQSTSTDTGGLVVTGGGGFGKNLFVGGSINATFTTGSTNPSTGSIICSGGVGIAENINIGGLLYARSTTDSSGTNNGSIICSGGIGVALKAQIGGKLTVYDSLNSTSITTGAIVTNGGLGTGKNIFAGGSINAKLTTDSSSISTGSVICDGGMGLAKGLYVGGGVNALSTLDTTGIVTLNNTTDSSSTATGAVIVKGGSALQKQLYVGGVAHFGDSLTTTGVLTVNDTTVSTDRDTGSVIIKGGVGIAKSINATGALNIDTPSSQITFTNSVSVSTIAKLAEGTTGLSIVRNISSADYVFEKFQNDLSTIRYGDQLFDSTTDSSSASTGAIRVSGGVALNKTAYIGGRVIYSHTTTDCTGAGPFNDLAINLNTPEVILTADPWTNNVHITGFVAGADGQFIRILLKSTTTVDVIIDSDSASSSVGNRIYTNTGANVTFTLGAAQFGMACIEYYSGYWHMTCFLP